MAPARSGTRWALLNILTRLRCAQFKAFRKKLISSGAGPLKKKAGTLRFNSSSFIAYANIFEVRLVLSKDDRKSSAKINIELLSVAVRIVAIECASTCYPDLNGVYVNPTSRLAPCSRAS